MLQPSQPKSSIFDRLLGPRNSTDLALFRILTVAAWLSAVDPRLAAHYSLYPPELSFPPSAWRHFITHLPVTTAAVWSAYALFIAAALASLIGWRTRWSLIAMLLTGGYVLTIPQFYGKIHHVNHLIWFALLLIASPCADALSLDARRPPKPPTHNPTTCAPRYSIPLFFAFLLVGMVYLFPGLWKLIEVGPRWATHQPMASLLHGKWIEFDGWTPWPRIDRSPLACTIGGWLTLTFEVLFIPLALWRRTRPLAIIGGVMFHISTYWFMRIELWQMLAGYSGLICWHRRAHTETTTPTTNGTYPAIAVGLFLLIGNIHNNLLHRNWWPLGAYPTFAFLAGPTIETLRVHATFPDGTQRTLTEVMFAEFNSPSRARGLSATILSSKDRDRRLTGYWKLWQRLDPTLEGAQHITFTAATVRTDPDHRGEIVAERVLLEQN